MSSAVISIPYDEFMRLKNIEENYNIMLNTWKPIPEKSLQKKAEKEMKFAEIKAQKEAEKLVKKQQNDAEKQATKTYISSETLAQEATELKNLKLEIARKANGKRLAALNAKRREEKAMASEQKETRELITYDLIDLSSLSFIWIITH